MSYSRHAAGTFALAMLAALLPQPVGRGAATPAPGPARHRTAHEAHQLAVVRPASTPPPVGPGYWLAAADGGVFSFGSARFFGSAATSHPAAPVVGMAATPDARGYWQVTSSGEVTAFGSAHFFGEATARHLGAPIVGIAATPHGTGYWLVASNGRVLGFGGARFFGSEADPHRGVRIVGMAATPDGGGYWLVSSAGGVHRFGDAPYFGSKATSRLTAPVVAIAATPDGGGYWLATSAGTVYGFGDARSFGSLPVHPGIRVTGLTPTPDGRGYWLVGSNGKVFSFGDAVYKGSMSGRRLRARVIARARAVLAAQPRARIEAGARRHVQEVADRPLRERARAGGRVVVMVANPLAVPSGALSILTTKLAPASASSPYHQELSATGGLPPYSWSLSGGQLPPGLALDGSRGLIEGTVSSPAVEPLIIRVEDKRGAMATVPLTLVAGLAPVSLQHGEGALAVSVDQLPAGTAASVTVAGPGGFERSVTATTEIEVTPGTYTVSASKVDDGTDTFYPALTGNPARVTVGNVAVVGVSYLTEVADTTKVVGRAALSDLRSFSGETMVFSPPPPSLAGVQAGDVVVARPSSAAPNGFLRRVTGVSRADGQLVLATAFAGLAQAVPRASFSVNWPASPVSAKATSHLVPARGSRGARARTQGSGTGGPCTQSFPCQFTVGPKGKPACGYASGTNPTTNPLQPISVDISPRFSVTPHFDASYSFPTTLEADAYVEVSESVSVSATIQSNVVCQYSKALWGPQRFGIPDIVFFIGPVPVDFAFLLEIDASIKAETTSLVTVPAETQGFTLTQGVRYDSQASPNFQAWCQKDCVQQDNQFSSPTGSGYLKASIGPKFTFALYGVVGPTAGIDGFARADLQSTAPVWDVGVGLEASLGFQLAILGWNLAFQVTIPILTAYLASEPPQFTSATELPTDETGSLATPYKAYVSALGFNKPQITWGPPPASTPKLPLQWGLGNCQLSVNGGDYNGFIPGSQAARGGSQLGEYVLVGNDPSSPNDGLVTLPEVPAVDAGTTLTFDIEVTDSLGQCSYETVTIPIIAGPHAETYPLANPEIGVPYVNYLQLAMLGLYNPPQGGTPPYICPTPPAVKRNNETYYPDDPTYPELADNVGLYISQAPNDQSVNSSGQPTGPDCTIRGTVPPSADPSVIAKGLDQPLYVADAHGGTVWDTLQMGPVAEPLEICDYDSSTGDCPPWPLESQQPSTVTAEQGVAFSSPSKAAYGVPLDQGPGHSSTYAYSLGSACGQDGYTTPPGIAIGTDGVLSGTPTQAGSYSFPVQAVDAAGACAFTEEHLNVVSPVAAGAATLPPAEVGVAYHSGSLTASGGTAPYGWQVTSVTDRDGNTVPLPAGLSVDSATGKLTGVPGEGTNGPGQAVPQPGTSGSYRVTFTVTDGFGGTASETLPLVVAPPLAVTSPVQLPPSTKGAPYSAQLVASGGAGGDSWSLVNGAMPDGLSLSPGGVIAGTPAADATTTIAYVQATDAAGGTASAAFVIPVGVAVTTTTLQEAEVGVGYSFAFTAAGGKPPAAGGKPPYTWRLAAGSGLLPAGLTLSAGGVVSGTPTAASAGAYPIAVQVNDAGGGSWTAQFTLEVAAPPTVEADMVPADLSTGYSYAPTVEGGVGPFSWSLVPGHGSLPPGLSLDATGDPTGTAGMVYGTPDALGSYGFWLEVTDAYGQSASGPASISVLDGPTVSTTYLPDGNVGVPYTGSLVAAGGVTTASDSYHWSLALADSLPPGLLLSPDGTLSGTPEAAAGGTTTVVQVTVQDYWGVTSTAALSIRIDLPLGLSALALPEGEVGMPYWAQIDAEGGYAPYTWRRVGSPPAGLAVSDLSTLSGTPAASGDDPGFMLCATDSVGTPGCTSPGVRIAPPVEVATTSLPDESDGQSFSVQLSATGGVLGTVGYTWSLPASATAQGYPLPPWLSLTGDGRLIGEVPAGVAGESFQVPVQVNDAVGASATATLTLVIVSPPPAPASTTTTPGATSTTLPGATTTTSVPTTTTTPALPELTTGPVSAAPTSVQAGASLDLSWTVDNTGDAPASGSWEDAVYLGTTPGATSTLLQLFSEPASSPVAAGSGYSDTQSVTIPAGTSAGTYDLTVVADSNGALAVSSTANASGSTAITVSAVTSEPTLRAVSSVEGNGGAIAVGDGGTVLVYDGSGWQAESSGTVNALYGLSYDDTGSSRAWAVGAHGTVLATTDNGSSWSLESSGSTEDLYGISCPATSTCWAVGAGGTILHTTDGSNWSPQSSGTTAILYGVSCDSTTNCWAVGAGGTILATTDGSTWNLQSSGSTETLYGISCPGPVGCWAVGAGGTIVSTYDGSGGGSGWTAEVSGTTADLYAVDVGGYCGIAPFGDCAYAVGAGGTMVSYGTQGWGTAPSGTTEDLYGLSYVGPYFYLYAAVGAAETEVTGTPQGA